MTLSSLCPSSVNLSNFKRNILGNSENQTQGRIARKLSVVLCGPSKIENFTVTVDRYKIAQFRGEGGVLQAAVVSIF